VPAEPCKAALAAGRDIRAEGHDVSRLDVHKRQDTALRGAMSPDALPDRPLILEGDLIRLTQVFTNILNNASVSRWCANRCRRRQGSEFEVVLPLA
jgi:hypothetical protein